MAYLKLILKSEMMSFGLPNYWLNEKNTNYTPTKSAIIGMIGAALGIQRGDSELEELSHSLTIYLNKKTNQSVSILTDFQTERPEKDITMREFIQNSFKMPTNKRTPTADGKKKDMPLPLTNKEYIQNGYFELFVEGNQNLLTEINHAFDFPIYPLYFGRRNCLPTMKINQEMLDSVPQNIEKDYSVLV